MQVRLLSGAGEYADPWHDFAGTSAAIAEIIGERADLEVDVRTDVEKALAGLDGVDLLVVNVGNPGSRRWSTRSFRAAQAGLERYLRAERPVWALHSAATSFPQMPVWERALGGRWVDGVSMHPPIDTAHVIVPASEHPIVAGLSDFEVYDERYTHLRHGDGIHPLAFHEHEGTRHPLLWTLQDGDRRAAYDALGHTVESYRNDTRREILRRTRDWLLPA